MAAAAAAEATVALTAAFVQPAVNATVTVSVTTTAPLSVWDDVYFAAGGHYIVKAVASATSVQLYNGGAAGNAAAGATIASGTPCILHPLAVGGSGALAVTAATSAGLLVDTRTLGFETDAFDRLRISEPVTLYDYSSVLGKMPLRFDEAFTGGAGATSTYSTGSYIAMSVAANGDSVVRQSKRYIPYQAGKSQLVLMTGVLALAGAALVTSRIGPFDGVNGHCFQMVGGAVSVVEFNAGASTTVARASWNVDPMDGTGPSGYNVDWTKGNIFVVALAWLGFGRVQMGLNISGRLWVCHEFTHAPTVSGGTAVSAPYMRYAALPMRYDISSTGGADTMRMTCGATISESGTALFGQPFSVLDTAAPRTVSTAVFVPLFTLTLRPDAGAEPWNRVNIRIKNINFINVTNNSYIAWALVKNVEFVGTAPTYVVVNATSSAAQTCTHVTGTTITLGSGYTFASGYSESRAAQIAVVGTEMGTMVALNSSISGTPETVTLMISLISGSNAVMYGGLSWEEVM